MTQQTSDDLLGAFDKAGLTRRYWVTITLLVLQEMFEFFDFFVVGYLVAVLAPRWHLTYGESGMMLLGAGLGAIFGALIFGRLADVFGRRPLTIIGGFVVALGAGLLALIPEDSWILFSLLRIIVGFGLGGAIAAQTPYTVEITPTRYRTFISSALVAPASLGILIAAVLSHQLLPVIGWRGLAAMGCIPGLIALGLLFVMPESTRWLLSRDRFDEARAAAARQMGVAFDSLPLPAAKPQTPPPAPLSDLLKNRRAFWLIVITWFGMSTTTYGYQLWGPTILSIILHIPVRDVAGYFVYVGIAGFAGRFVFSALPVWIGRRHSGEIMGWGAAILILAAGIFRSDFVAGVPAFVICLTGAAIFINGGFSNMGPYAAESYPVGLAARATGLAQGVNGVGKMLGPLILALIAGTSNVVAPKATESAVLPAFAFLAACSLAAGLAYTLLPIETHGRALTIKGEADHPALPVDRVKQATT